MIEFNRIVHGDYSIAVEHYPGKERPVLVVSVAGSGDLEVGEITNEPLLKAAAFGLFGDATPIGKDGADDICEG